MAPPTSLVPDACGATTPADVSSQARLAADATHREGTTDGRYTLRRELARGGMGRIWIADDARLSRRVAIKELLEPTGRQAARFDRELSLTSRLEHPSIVSIHDGGRWEDGTPFYVMKIVSGESLDRVIARSQSLAERLALLSHGVAAVDALAYAHAQGIVHRDLKPDNILIGSFGETVVIDWGLAKDLRAATSELVEGPYRDLVPIGATIGGEVMGTPAYMPPEQALGDAVDERADVYALGAALYQLITGAPPHQGTSVEDVLAKVISKPPRALATAAPGVPSDLVAIVEKAMAREPKDRYPTASELATDLKRFQSGNLVGAHRYTGRQLLWRWLRKHRTAVAVASIAVLALVTLGTVSFTRIVGEKREAHAARLLAERHRGEANDRRAAAEDLMVFMLGDLRVRLEPIGKLALLELPARKALAFYDARRAQLGPNERYLRAVALENLGDVLRARQDLAGALATYQEATEERRLLAAAGHVDPAGNYRDASLRASLGDLFALQNASADGVREYRTAIAMFSTLRVSNPSDPRGAKGQLTCMGKLGALLTARGDHDAAATENRGALALATELAQATPADVDAQLAVVGPQNTVGDSLLLKGDHAGALVAYRAALERITPLSQRGPEDTARIRIMHLTHQRIGIALAAQQDLAAALEHYRISESLGATLVTHDPTNAGWQFEYATSKARLAEALQATGNAASAVAAYRGGLEVLRMLDARDPTHVQVSRDRVVIHLQLSELLGEQRAWPAAEIEARAAVELGQLRLAQERTIQNQRDLNLAYSTLGSALLALGRPVDALAEHQRGLVLARQLVESEPKELFAHQDLQQNLVEVGNALCAARRHGDPRPSYDEALAISARVLASTPGDQIWTELHADAGARAKACRF